MPFAQLQYRSLINSPLGWQARRQRFLCITIAYTTFFLCLAFVFLGLYINERNALNEYTCEICASEGTPYQCGNQQCCDKPDGIGSFYYNSFQYCLGDYAELIFFIIMIVLFAYVAYEVFMLVCTVCTAPIFYPGAQMVAAPVVGMTTAGYGPAVIM